MNNTIENNTNVRMVRSRPLERAADPKRIRRYFTEFHGIAEGDLLLRQLTLMTFRTNLTKVFEHKELLDPELAQLVKTACDKAYLSLGKQEPTATMEHDRGTVTTLMHISLKRLRRQFPELFTEKEAEAE